MSAKKTALRNEKLKPILKFIANCTDLSDLRFLRRKIVSAYADTRYKQEQQNLKVREEKFPIGTAVTFNKFFIENGKRALKPIIATVVQLPRYCTKKVRVRDVGSSSEYIVDFDTLKTYEDVNK